MAWERPTPDGNVKWFLSREREIGIEAFLTKQTPEYKWSGRNSRHFDPLAAFQHSAGNACLAVTRRPGGRFRRSLLTGAGTEQGCG
jgi:hypothetical protein